MPVWPLDSSSGLLNTTEGFGDAALWNSCVPQYRPLTQPTTRQPNNEFNNSRWHFDWHYCHFVLKLQFIQSDSTQLTVLDTNATLWFFEQLQKSELLRNELIGAGQNLRWIVKSCKRVGGGGKSFENCRGHSGEINIDFHWLRRILGVLVGNSTQLASNV